MAAPITTTYDAAERATAIGYILQRVSGGWSVARALREGRNDGVEVPSHRVFWSWHHDNVDLQHQLACARLNGVEANLEMIPDIADAAEGDDSDVSEFVRKDAKWARLRVETRIKMAQMIAPRKYGPKLDLTSAGDALGAAGGLTPSERAARATGLATAVLQRTIEHQPSVKSALDDMLD